MGRETKSNLPGTYRKLQAAFPEITAAHDEMASAVEHSGPLDEKTCALIKIGVSVGAGLESALRSHVRRAMQAGASEDEIVQAVFQGMNTIGFPKTVAAWSWAQVQFERNRQEDAQ
ncbi:MAG: carboxymuconolactone decarboxylase family protein [Aureliella sp.]